MTEVTPNNRAVRGRNRPKRMARTAGTLAAVAVLGFAAACSENSVTAPELSRSNGLIGTLVSTVSNVLASVTGLLRTAPLKNDVVRTAVISNATGGKITIPETGFELDIPAGALPSSSMTIKVTALAGKVIAYEFEPHGTKFSKPLTFKQDLGVTNYLSNLLGGQLSGGYFKDESQLNQTTGAARVNETFVAKILSSKVQFDIVHFSGYMVSTGKAQQMAAPEEF